MKEGSERAYKRQKEAHKGLIENNERLTAPHFHGKVRDTEFPDQIKDLGKIREGLKRVKEGSEKDHKLLFCSYLTGPVSFSGDVLRPMKRRYRGTKADTGFVTVTNRQSL